MATLDHQEQEQLDNLKHVWKDYGSTIVLALVAAALGYGGMQGWKAWKNHTAARAAVAYAPFEQALKSGTSDVAKLSAIAGAVQKDYPESSYAARADLQLAKLAFEAGDLKTAQSRLEHVLANNKDVDVLATARLRLAAVQLDSGKPDEALKTLDGQHPGAYEGLFDEARGDVLARKGNKAAARQAYQKALTTAEPQQKMFLEWKLDALGA